MNAPTNLSEKTGRSLAPAFSAIDLGTNNCRLLVAVPQRAGFRVIDAYSQIVRLGEGVSRTGRLSERAMARTIDALKSCAEKIVSRQVIASSNIATEACRAAENGEAFLEEITSETGLNFDIVTAEQEAALSVRGCSDLIDPRAKAILVFDIGGGSTELSWLKVMPEDKGAVRTETLAWTSLPLGVVTLAERYDVTDYSSDLYNALAQEVVERLAAVHVPQEIKTAFVDGQAHLIGTSGTVTSMAGVHLHLDAYNRRAVDGLWMSEVETRIVAERLRLMTMGERASSPCIGRERADLVVGGCAILEGIMRAWPAARIRVGDRGLREGLLLDLIAQWRVRERAS